MATNQDSNTEQTRRPASGRRRAPRGWLAVAIGCILLAALWLIGNWVSLFAFVLAPLGIFMVVAGVVEIGRGTGRLK